MIIANPIYDVVFKRLMENEKVAQFFIGTLLNTDVADIEVQPQEFTYTDELVGVSIFRLDFIATIRTEDGVYKKVLIEIQKAKNQIDLMRFRNYLSEQYKKEDTINGKRAILPITTIYILGFNLADIDTPCIKVARHYTDMIHHKIIHHKNDFVEKLTHDCFIVQVERITDRYQTTLDKLLSLFEQKHFIDDTKVVKEFKHTIDHATVQLGADILHHTGTTPSERKQIEIEQEAWRTINAMMEDALGDMTQKIENFHKTIKEQEKEISEKVKTISEKDKELTEKDKELTEKDKELSEKEKLIEDLKKQLMNKK